MLRSLFSTVLILLGKVKEIVTSPFRVCKLRAASRKEALQAAYEDVRYEGGNYVNRLAILVVAAFLAMMILVPVAGAQSTGGGGTGGGGGGGGNLPSSGGPAIILPAAALLVGSGVLTFAVLRRK